MFNSRFVKYIVCVLMWLFICSLIGCNDADINTGISTVEELEKISQEKNELSKIFDNNSENKEKESNINEQPKEPVDSQDSFYPNDGAEYVYELEKTTSSGASDKNVVVDDTKFETVGNTPIYDNTDNSTEDTKTITYILNKSTKKFHYQHCNSASRIKAQNKGTGTDRAKLIAQGYNPCKVCNP